MAARLSRGGVVAIAGLAALAVLVLILSVLALGQHRGSAPAPTPPATPTASQQPTPEDTPGTTPTSTPTGEPARAVAPARLVTALSTGTLLRATTGRCDGPAPAVSYSTDGGATWQPGDLAEANATAILRFVPGDIGQAITLDGECAPSGMWSFSEGADWEATAGFVGTSWRFDPARPDVVATPAGTDASLPCRALTLSAYDTTAVALCDDDTVVTTTDGAATWSERIEAPGALTVNASADGFRVLARGGDDCAGVRLSALADGALQTPGGCLEARFAPGEVALSSDPGNTVTAWVGDVYARSTDSGATWG
jgi:hypothetical protein